MSDHLTITTRESWVSRLKSSISGVLTGIVLVIASIVALWINEGRAVKTAKGLKEGSAAVVSAESATIDPANDGKLVHVSGAVTTSAPLTDPGFGIQEQALQLIRKVEMYQWRETSRSTTRDKPGGGRETTTTYSYEKVWSDQQINSSGFKQPEGHTNPAEMRYKGERWIAQDARLGAFRFHTGLAGRLTGATPLLIQEGNYRYESNQKPVLRDGGLFFGENPDAPEAGDLRIRWEVLRPGEASVVAGQKGDGFEAYQTRSGTNIELVSPGIVSAASMFSGAVASNRTLTWGLRVGGVIAMFVGFTLIFRPLVTVGHLIPVGGQLLDAGLTVVSGVLAGVLSLLVIAFSWLAYRPLLAVALLGAAAVLVIASRQLSRGRKSASGPAPAFSRLSSHP